MNRFGSSTLMASMLLFAILLVCLPGLAQRLDPATWAVEVSHAYKAFPNITYLTANNFDAKLDVYMPRSPGLKPTLIYIHGGGWHHGSREGADGILPISVLAPLPYMEMGWAVVNVEYRLNWVSLAPAAVEDCRCALRWVIQHAKQYNFDTSKLVVSGHSAGGHLL